MISASLMISAGERMTFGPETRPWPHSDMSFPEAPAARISHRGLGLAVRYKFHRCHQPVSAPDIANQLVFFLKVKAALIDLLAPRGRVLRDIQALRFGKAGKRRGGADRMARIGISVADGGFARFIGFENFGDLWRDHDRAEGKIAVCDGLRRAGKIGFYPQCRDPDQEPVRPKPVITSSAIRRIPFRSQMSRTIGMKLSWGGMTPPAPRTGSMMKAAMLSAP